MTQRLISGSQTYIAYVPETNFNVTPTNPTLTELPRQSETLNMTKALINDPTITSDGLQSEDRHGNIATGGDLKVSLRHGIYDDFLSAVMGNAWSGNVLKNGTTPTSDAASFTFEIGDPVHNVFDRFTGVRVNSLNIGFDPGQIISATFGLMGAGMTSAATSLDADGLTELPSASSMSHVGGTIKIGGTNALVTGGSMTINRNMEDAYAFGSSTALDVVPADSEVSGDLTLYRESNLTNYNIFLNEQHTTLTISITDGQGNFYEFFFPLVKFNSASREVGTKGLLFMPVGWKAYRFVDGDGSTYSCRITRTIAA